MTIYGYVLCIIAIFVGIYYLINRIEYLFFVNNKDKYKIKLIDFKVISADKANENIENKYERLFDPQYYAYITYEFEYNNKKYILKDYKVDTFHNVKENNYGVFEINGYKELKQVLNLNFENIIYYYREKIISKIKRDIYNIKLEESKQEIERMISNEWIYF